MDAPLEPHDAGGDEARPRSAPAFCRPKPVAPKPYRPAGLRKDAGARTAASQGTPGLRRESVREAPAVSYAEPTVAGDSSRHSQSRPAEPRREVRPEAVRLSWEDLPSDSDEAEATTAGPAWTAMARGVALFLGTLLAADLFGPGGLSDGGPWWLDTRPLPQAAATGFLALSSAVLVLFGLRPALPRPVRWVATLCLVLLIALALKNGTVYYGLLKRGDLHAGSAVAFPLHVAACFGVVLLASRFRPGPGGFRGLLLTLFGFNAALVSFPAAQIACCGPIDARRPAAAAVVFGPRAFEADGEARFDERVRAAAALHKAGLVPTLLLTGGVEGERLARLKKVAAEGGVPESAITALPQSDEKSVLAELSRRFPVAAGQKPVLLAVSDADHLPRVTVLARRAGVSVSPVPAQTKAKPKRQVLLRETLDLWRCYFRR